MGIEFIRIDDRVIHGQLVTRWSKEKKCEGIIAVDDATSKDETLCQILKSAVPDTIKTFIFDIDTFVQKYPKIQESNKAYFLIVKSPITLQKIIEKGTALNEIINIVNVGPMSTRDDSITIGPNASVLPSEGKAFDFLLENNIDVEFRLVPDSQKQSWDQVKLKFNI